MITQELYEQVIQSEGFYALLYCPNRDTLVPLEEDIIFIKSKGLRWNGKYFYNILGWPGGPIAIYDINSYNKSWSFDKDKLLETWQNK